MFITMKKIKTILNLLFFIILKKLDYFLKFIKWLCINIKKYAQLAGFFQAKKTDLIRNINKIHKITAEPVRKTLATRFQLKKPFSDELKTFQNIQNAFRKNSFLMHFQHIRFLFIDVNVFKESGFAIMIYYFKVFSFFFKNSDSKAALSRIDVEPIMFLFKFLNGSETKYGFTKFEMTALIGIIKKIRHMIESVMNMIIIYINHAISIFITRQTTLIMSFTNKLNFHLIRVFQYLSRLNISLRHKTEKANMVFNVLSKLKNVQLNENNKENIFENLYNNSVSLNELKKTGLLFEQTITMYTDTLMKFSQDFKKKLIETYEKNKYFKKMLTVIKKITDSFKHFMEIRFVLRNELIYYVFMSNPDRLCISDALVQNVFELAHDKQHHSDFHQIYTRLDTVFIKHLTKFFKNYIKYCFICSVNGIICHKPFGELHFYNIFDIFYHMISMNFVTVLFEIIINFNIMFTMINKFIKKIMFILKKNIGNFVNGTNVLFRELMRLDGDLFLTIISNRDRKFIISFGGVIGKKMNIFLLIITTGHSQTNGQFKKTNQIIEIIFHYHFTKYFDDLGKGNFILLFIQIEHNNIKNFNINYVSNEFITNFKIHDFSLHLFYDLSFENFFHFRQMKRNKIGQTLNFNNIFAKLRYDKKTFVFKTQGLCIFKTTSGLQNIGKKF